MKFIRRANSGRDCTKCARRASEKINSPALLPGPARAVSSRPLPPRRVLSVETDRPLLPFSIVRAQRHIARKRERERRKEGRRGINCAQFASQEDNGKKKEIRKESRDRRVRGKKGGEERRRAPGRTGYRICFFFLLFFLLRCPFSHLLLTRVY